MFPGGELRAQVILTDILGPVISDPVASPSELWPPNHKMKNVSVSYTNSDNFPGTVTCQLSVTSNEPVTSAGDNTSPDWIVNNNSSVQLRAERNGNGNGRVYTITVTCTDAQGNSSSKTTTVTVAHDQGSRLITRTDDATDVPTRPSMDIFPNPSRNHFVINIQSDSREKINISVVDLLGRTVERRNNLIGSQIVRMGSALQPGVYYVVIRQGNITNQLKVVKINAQ
jgi:hypothetical protein